MLGTYLFDKQNVSIVVVFNIPCVVTFFPCQRLDQCTPRLFFFSFSNKMLSQMNGELLWVPLKRAAMMFRYTASSWGRDFRLDPSPPYIGHRCEISSIVWIWSFDIKRGSEMHLPIRFDGNSISISALSFTEGVDIQQTCNQIMYINI